MIPTRRDFTNAQANARRRGIKWDLTFETWSAPWVASGRYAERGRKRGQYQMDRIHRDRGYSTDNVQIIDGRTNRTKDSPHGWRQKLTEEAARDILDNFQKGVRGWRYFADKYGVTAATVKAVRTGRNWSSVQGAERG